MSLLRRLNLWRKHPGVPSEYRACAESDEYVVLTLEDGRWVVLRRKDWLDFEQDIEEAKIHD
jgi:hypothetical protein